MPIRGYNSIAVSTIITAKTTATISLILLSSQLLLGAIKFIYYSVYQEK
jgi:hypothetical protein